MADMIRKVMYYSASISNRPGQGAKILDSLSKSGVNLLAFTGFPEAGRAQVDFVPDNSALFLRAAKQAGLKLRKKKFGCLVQGKDRIGAISTLMKKLAAAKINVTAIDALCAGKDRFGAILWVKPNHVAKATKILRAK